MSVFKWLFKSDDKKLIRKSDILTVFGGQYEISNVYQKLLNKENIHITSVSITRVDHDGMKGYVNNYMIAISYDYYGEKP